MTHEARIGPRPSGIYIPEWSDNARLIGRVFGVGAGVEGFQFGDVLELSAWNCGIDQGWLRNPMKILGGPRSGKYWMVDGERGIEADVADWWVILLPDQIIYRICRWDWERGVEAEEPGEHPVGDRVKLAHRGRAAMSRGGVATPDMRFAVPPVAQVLEVGDGADGFAAGDWVYVPPTARLSKFIGAEGQVYSMARASDVALNFGPDEPGEIEIDRI